MCAERRAADGRFPTTRWSLVARAGCRGEQSHREALNDLLTCYLPAMRAHLVYGRGLTPDDADDVAQEFVAGKILQRDLIGRADRELGRFRTFLLTALDRFLFNWLRDRRAKKRSAEGPAAAAEAIDNLPTARAASDAFEVEWARRVVHEALTAMRRECEDSGRMDVWGVFECRIVAPLLDGQPPADYQQLVDRFGLQSPAQASNLLITGKRMYARTLRAVVGQYARDPVEIESELLDLRKILAQATAPETGAVKQAAGIRSRGERDH